MLKLFLPATLMTVVLCASAATTDVNDADIDEYKQYITKYEVVTDTARISRMKAEFEAKRDRNIENYLNRRRNFEAMALRAGKKVETDAESRYLDTVIRIGGEKQWLTPKIVKDAHKGKISKDLREILVAEAAEAQAIADSYSRQTLILESLPKIGKTTMVPNPFYRPVNVARPDILDRIDRKAQTEGWEWLDKDEKVSDQMFYPIRSTYTEYPDHPGYRVIDDYFIYNENGDLVRVKSMLRDPSAGFTIPDSARTVMLKKLAAADFERNRYGIREEHPETVAEVMTVIIDNGDNAFIPEGDEGFMSPAVAWLMQIFKEHTDEMRNIYRIDRLDPRAFRVLFLDEYGNTTWVAEIEFEGINFEITRMKIDIREAPVQRFDPDETNIPPSKIAPTYTPIE